MSKRAALYARVSSEEQARDDKLSIEIQLLDNERYCHEHDLTVVEHYIDIQSGRDAKKDRENFERMLRDCYANKFDVIVVWRPDRAYRGLMPAAKLKRALDETGVDIAGAQQTLGKNLLGLWAWVAEEEVEGMTQRFKANKRAQAKAGKWQGGFVKYGYRYNDNKRSPLYTGELEIDQTEAEVVRGLFEWVANGKPAASWCRWANGEGIPTKRSSQGWTPQTVSEMLRDRTYTGKGAYGKLTRRGNKMVAADDPVLMEYPAIISEELFNRVQPRLSENSKKSHGAAKRFYMLQHLGRCGECDGPLCCSTNSYGYRYLYCLNQRRFPHIYACYKPQSWAMGLVERYVWGGVEELLDSYSDACLVRLSDELDTAEQSMEATIARAKKELERCQLERQRLLTAMRKGYATERHVELQFKAVNEDEEHWQSELAKAETVRANLSAVQHSMFDQIGKVLQTKDWWWDTTFGFTAEQKKEILNALLDKSVLYRDGRIELRLKLPATESQVVEVIATASRNDTTLGNNNYESMDTALLWLTAPYPHSILPI